MTTNPWTQLWESLDSTVRIELTDDPNDVIVHFEDSSVGELVYEGGDWRHLSVGNSCPCDVAARDSL